MANLSTDAPITPLRQRMQQDRLMRGLGPHTQQDYVRHVRRFAAFLGRALNWPKEKRKRQNRRLWAASGRPALETKLAASGRSLATRVSLPG